MSNIFIITPTQFTDVRSGDVSYGVVASDSYDADYVNHWDSIPDDDLELIKEVYECCSTAIQNMFDYVREHEQAIWVSETPYEWHEVGPVLEALDNETTNTSEETNGKERQEEQKEG